jgi:hypothetical protein
MNTFVNWLTGVSLIHLIGVVALAVLLAIGVGPQETELIGLFGLVGLAIPTGTGTASPPAAT